MQKESQNPQDTFILLFGVALPTFLIIGILADGIMELGRGSLKTSLRVLNVMDKVV